MLRANLRLVDAWVIGLEQRRGMRHDQRVWVPEWQAVVAAAHMKLRQGGVMLLRFFNSVMGAGPALYAMRLLASGVVRHLLSD